MSENLWALIIVAAICLTVVVAYKFKPSLFSFIMGPTWVPVKSPHAPTGCGVGGPNVGATSLADCQKKCVDTPGCLGVYRNPDHNTCWIKQGTVWCQDASVDPNPSVTDGGYWAYTPRAGGAPSTSA